MEISMEVPQKTKNRARHWWFVHGILAPWEAEIGRIAV
jgi:hypothetical protein